MKTKKAIVPVVGALLLIIISSVIGIIAFQWIDTFESSFNAKNEFSGSIGELEPLSLNFVNSTQSQLFVRNTGSSYHVIDQVIVNSTKCLLLDSNVIDDIDVLNLNCSVTLYNTYGIDIYSDKGSYQKYLTVLE